MKTQPPHPSPTGTTMALFLGALLLLLLPGLTGPVQAQPILAPHAEPIVMWSGTLSEIPQGWQLCDGTNGTPDLRDRFVQSIVTEQELGEIGGTHTQQLQVSHLPSHTHGIWTSTSRWQDHVHLNYEDKYSESVRNGPDGLTSYPGTYLGYAQSRTSQPAGNHNHTGTTDLTGSSLPVDNRPLYYRLAFITRLPPPPPTPWSPPYPSAAGCIVMWSGNGDTPPPGWLLCDGSNGTPDLQDRFILGTQTGQEPGEIGGAHQVSLGPLHLPSHDHPFTTDDLGDHTHVTYDELQAQSATLWYGGIFPFGQVLVGDEDVAWRTSALADAHTHTGGTSADGQGLPLDNRPAYLRLPLIMRGPDTRRPSRSVPGLQLSLPVGSIAIWANSLLDLPRGWQLCDGTNGTPDLRDRFVVGGQSPGEVGGSHSSSLTLSTMPAHSHVIASMSWDPGHAHVYEDHWRKSSTVWDATPFSSGYGCGTTPHILDTSRSMFGSAHSHTGTTNPAGLGTPYENRPAYYKAAFIMRVR